MTAAAPRHYVSVPGLHGAGLPQDRLARIAARQAFVDLKASFLDAVAALRPGRRADWLRAQVRAAEEPVDLWLLRSAIFAELDHPDTDSRRLRHAMRRRLDAVFPDSGPPSGFAAL
jgi:hypothetical protein